MLVVTTYADSEYSRAAIRVIAETVNHVQPSDTDEGEDVHTRVPVERSHKDTLMVLARAASLNPIFEGERSLETLILVPRVYPADTGVDVAPLLESH